MKKIYQLCLFFFWAGGITNLTYACTVISCAKHGEVFAAANEDDYTPFVRMWFNPATKSRFGSVCFGVSDLQIGAAMNEFGLFYDYTAQYGIDPWKYNQKNPYKGDLMFEILGKCKTVKEALVYLNKYDYAFPSQVMLADATGNSIIVNPSTKVVRTGSFQVSTNFNIADAPAKNYNCRRFDIAQEMLNKADQVNEDLMKTILDRTHQEGNLSTQYSAVYDLKRGNVTLYLFHNFNAPYRFNLKNELMKGYRMGKIENLFPPSFAYESYAQGNQLYKKEQILDEIQAKGLLQGTEKYIITLSQSTKRDSAFKFALLEVALQLVKDSYNQHSNGSSWAYWSGFDGGFLVSPYQDKRLIQAQKLLNGLARQEDFDPKYVNFIKEIEAYVLVTLDQKQQAKVMYTQIIEKPQDAYPVSIQRATAMLKTNW